MSQALEKIEIDKGLREQMANAIRFLSMDAVQAAKSGHPGMPMGMADVATVLFSEFLKFDASEPNWPDRDRFVLSAGHGSMLIYALLYLTGYPGIELDDIKNFRQLGRPTAGHPEYGHLPGIETTTGPLGQGISTAVGMALGEAIHNARHGDDIADHYTYVIAGDGCLMEGISHEAISLAGHLKLNKLIVLWDDNDITIDGKVELSCRDDQLKRFEASNWNVMAIDGHDMEAISAAIAKAKSSDKPTLIACKTIIGKGAPTKQGTSATHGSPLGDEEIAASRKELGWDHAPFELPEPVLATWRAVGQRGKSARQAWEKQADKLDGAVRAQLVEPVTDEVKKSMAETVQKLKADFISEGKKLATRQSSKIVLDGLVPLIPGIIGGSADLTGSNGTKTDQYNPVQTSDYDGNYVHYGIREHGMAAAMNGLALHGGFMPYSGTFLVFADYCRPAIRLSALMEKRVVYVMTHDSIGLGEDGPTHQPVEHLASLRAIPNLNVYRPADHIECAECWELALGTEKTPSIMTLTRQGLPILRDGSDNGENLSAKGAYVLKEADGERDATVLASGSEVEIAVAAAEKLAEDGVNVAVVSMPCWELFEQQSADYQWQVLGEAPRVGVEAAIAMGWSKWLGTNGQFVGMNSFGASGPAPELYEHFGITPKHVAQAVKRVTGNS